MMKHKHQMVTFMLLALFFGACDSDLVSRAEYDAALSRADSLEARCDELEFENLDLKLYKEYMEEEIRTSVVLTPLDKERYGREAYLKKNNNDSEMSIKPVEPSKKQQEKEFPRATTWGERVNQWIDEE